MCGMVRGGRPAGLARRSNAGPSNYVDWLVDNSLCSAQRTRNFFGKGSARPSYQHEATSGPGQLTTRDAA